MRRPLLLIHGYSATGLDFRPLKEALIARGINSVDVNIANYVSLNNEITIKDIAEGLDRAFLMRDELKTAKEFDAIVHSTGMLVMRSWLTNYGAAVGSNDRLKKLKHLIGVAPATWGSPQGHKGRTWLGALVKGSRTPGPDFLNAGDQVLDGLELGSAFTWDLALADLVGPAPYYGNGPDTPYVAVFIGNQPYEGLTSVANDPGTDGTVRWAGCGLNTRKITIDLTRTPIGDDGKPTNRASITHWADERLDVPLIAVDGRDHGTLISNADPGMVDRIASFLKITDEAGHTTWLAEAKTWSAEAKKKMLVDPGKDAAGAVGALKKFIGHWFHLNGKPMEGWQQFVVHVRDEHGDPIKDFMIEIMRKNAQNEWESFIEMSTDVHAYGPDQSYRCFHVRLPEGICDNTLPLQIQIHASTGTNLVAYQGYGSNVETHMQADSAPVVLDLNGLGKDGRDSLFHPFTTTMVEIVLNRVPTPLGAVSQLFDFLKQEEIEAAK